jgi:hypothetical protein
MSALFVTSCGTVVLGRELLPIPLGVDGTSTHGVIFDYFRLVARAASAASRAGTPLDAKNVPREVGRPRTVVVAQIGKRRGSRG